MDTRKLLEELENVINNASEVPLTNKKLVGLTVIMDTVPDKRSRR